MDWELFKCSIIGHRYYWYNEDVKTEIKNNKYKIEKTKMGCKRCEIKTNKYKIYKENRKLIEFKE